MKSSILSISVATVLLLVTFQLLPAVSASSSVATFSGKASVQLVGKDSSGKVVTLRLTDQDFMVTVTAGGPGVGTITLAILGLTLGPDPVGTGQIRVSNMAAGGGTLANPATGYMSQFGFGVNGSGGQFQCQNTGRSAAAVNGFMGLKVLQMDVHGTVTAGSLTIS